MRRLYSYFIGILFVLCFSNQVFAGQVDVDAYVSDKSPCVGDSLDFTISISGAFSRYSPVDMPDIDGFKVYGRGTSQSLKFVNGRMSNSVEMNYMLIPLKEGDFSLPSLTVIVDGKRYSTERIKIKVSRCAAKGNLHSSNQQSRPISPSAIAPKSSSDKTFATITFSKKDVYVGEPLVATYTIYTRSHITFKGFNKQPDFSGFVKKEVPSNQLLKTNHVYIGGKDYVAAQVYKFILVPIKSGHLPVYPGSLLVGVEQKTKDMFGDFFDVFNFDDFFSTEVPQELNLPEQTISVKPLPERPKGFSGAIGDFLINANIDNTTVDTGQAITLTVEIKGKGDLSAVDKLDIGNIEGVKVYQSSLKDSQSIEGDNVVSIKRFEFIIIPQKPGDFTIPRLRFVYFSPKDKEYKELFTKEIYFSATGKAITDKSALEQQATTSFLPIAQNDTELQQDIDYIKTDVKVDALSFNFNMRLLLGNIIFLLVILSYLYYEKLYNLQKTDRFFNKKTLAMKRFFTAYGNAKTMVDENPAEAIDIIGNAFTAFIADKAKVPAGLVESSSIHEVLGHYRLNDPEKEFITSVLNKLSALRFAGSAVDRNSALSAMQDAERAVKLLDRRAL